MQRLEDVYGDDVNAVHGAHALDAVNLVHYLALRHGDVRRLQRALGERGLSSLGRCEPHVLATVESVLTALDGREPAALTTATTFDEGRRALDRNTDSLFGPRPHDRVTRIMVTLPSEAAQDAVLVRHLVSRGMDVARINGAHDGPEQWEQMAEHVRRASREVGRPCRVSMDLPGPKLRTTGFVDGPQVVRLRPRRDLRGLPVSPAVIELTAAGAANDSPGGLPVDPAWLARRRTGDVIRLADTRGSRRALRVVQSAPTLCSVEVWDTTYVETGTMLACGRDRTGVGQLPHRAQFHVLRPGDCLVLTATTEPVEPWHSGQPGCARIGCSEPRALSAARVGQRVLLDDGKIDGIVESTATDELRVRILRASRSGSRLRGAKGINLPDTDLPFPAVSDADLPLLGVAAARADMVALSFLHDEHDVDDVRDYLRRAHADHLGLILKIETTGAFRRLPELLLHAMQSPLVGVMIARGDLAVEAGYERLAEVQEEILWLCEAAHLPVIWATEVLDQLARTGQPSRAEVTDAAMAQRAECVMLNKGPHVVEAIRFLSDIIGKMSRHQSKKYALLGALHSWPLDAIAIEPRPRAGATRPGAPPTSEPAPGS